MSKETTDLSIEEPLVGPELHPDDAHYEILGRYGREGWGSYCYDGAAAMYRGNLPIEINNGVGHAYQTRLGPASSRHRCRLYATADGWNRGHYYRIAERLSSHTLRQDCAACTSTLEATRHGHGQSITKTEGHYIRVSDLYVGAVHFSPMRDRQAVLDDNGHTGRGEHCLECDATRQTHHA